MTATENKGNSQSSNRFLRIALACPFFLLNFKEVAIFP